MGEDKKHHPGSENLKPIKKGEVRNPKGRPKGSKNVTTLLKKMLERNILYEDMEGVPTELTIAEAITNNMLKTALNSFDKKDQLKAMDMVLDRTEGKPIQYVEQKEVPTTNDEAIERLKDVAKQEGISFEELCDREGIKY